VSPLELVDDRFEKLAEELRAARPAAPEALRARVHALTPPPPPRFELNLRRFAPAVALGGLAAALGVAVVLGIVHGSSLPPAQKRAVPAPKTVEHAAQAQKGSKPTVLYGQRLLGKDAARSSLVPFADRLQRYDAFLRVRVHDQDELSKHTHDALRLTRKLGGYLVWARYAAPRRTGDSELVLRIPVENVQEAIAGFSGYGTLVRQRIVLKDLQQRVDSLTARIARLRKKIAKGEPGPQLRRDKALLAALTSQRSSAVRRGQLAQVALTMVVGKTPAAAHGRFRRTIDDALSVLARELEILLYAALVAGPLLAVGGAGILAGRSMRRRADRRLLERT
jgi:hypothetical protein